MKVKIYYGYHGRNRDIMKVEGEIDDTWLLPDGQFVRLTIDGKYKFVAKDKICLVEEL